MKNSWKKVAVAASTAALIFAACGSDVEPVGQGSFDLSWDVSPRGCEAADVEVVELSLTNAHRSYVEQYDCQDGSATLHGLQSATYDLELIGLDAVGHTTFASDRRVVEIRPERTNTADVVRLTAKPATMRVHWTFENSRVCGANGVERVEVALFDSAYYEVARRTFGCDRGSGVVEGLRAGSYTVEAVAESSEGGVFDGLTETSVKRGASSHVDVVLE